MIGVSLDCRWFPPGGRGECMTSARFMPSMSLCAGLLLLLPLGLLLFVFCDFFFRFYFCCFSGIVREGWDACCDFLLLFICGTAGWDRAEWKGGPVASACDVQHRDRLESGLLCMPHIAVCPSTKP